MLQHANVPAAAAAADERGGWLLLVVGMCQGIQLPGAVMTLAGECATAGARRCESTCGRRGANGVQQEAVGVAVGGSSVPGRSGLGKEKRRGE